MSRTNSLIEFVALAALALAGATNDWNLEAVSQVAVKQTTPAPKAPQSAATTVDAELHAAAWKILTDGSSSERARTRSDALSALAILGLNPKSLPMIENALGDREERIRILAATSLGEIKARSSIPALKKAMEDRSPEVSFAAAQTLWKIGDHSGRDIFYEVLAGERKTQPGVIKSNLEQARKDMHDPKALAMIGIDQASGAFLGPFSLGVSAIEEFAKNTSAPVKVLCVRLLAADNSPETLGELRGALADKNWPVRAAAARALADMNHAEVIPQLKEMMKDDKEEPVRFVAAAAIIRLSQSAAAAYAKPAAPVKTTALPRP